MTAIAPVAVSSSAAEVQHPRRSDAGKTCATLLALLATLPIDLALVGLALLRRVPDPAGTAGDGRTVLISGGKMTKALQLARAFHVAGHRVVLIESAKYRLTGHRFSRAVDAFHCRCRCRSS